ncbi:uncharacterized protein LOC133785028 [Humulus lupulus]|uniref:uncharacterized protein LOC133785028 n=1 Tax=Humulus lupulus TaxID=3486 RepID=UPI002B400814|nr:uncharacterized protein LOC133785028 [Humulus lupulus]
MKRNFKSIQNSSTSIGKNDKITKSSYADVNINLENLESDPGLRTPIMDHPLKIRDQVRRAYMQKGPCQPHLKPFPSTKVGTQSRAFNGAWYEEFQNWLEYSVSKDGAFCLYCYLFKSNCGGQSGGDSFVGQGFRNFKNGKARLYTHVGGPSSVHNQARKMCEALMNEKQHIQTFFEKQSKQARSEYRSRLEAVVDCIRFLLRQGLVFRGDDESGDSSNQGNFLEILKFLADHNEDIKAVTLTNAPENLKLTSPDIQKDIVRAAAFETLDIIIKEIGDALFSILVDESRDISTKEQMAVVLRYVDKDGRVIERFVGIEHVANTTAVSLKGAIDKLFSRYGLSISKLRGQGYDGASNMQGEFSGLKTLILNENPSAFYVHCFAHQLQLALVAVAKKHILVAYLFSVVTMVINAVGCSSKRCDILREKQDAIISEALKCGEISSGRGLNQETNLKRPSDTRWGSHYATLVSLINLFSPITNVLQIIVDDGRANSEQRFEASNLLSLMLTFDFIFSLHLMKALLGITNELSKALQRKDQDIANAMKLVEICKKRLQAMRDNEWDSFLNQVSTFCAKYNVDVPDMDDTFVAQGRSRRKTQEMTNLHHYRVEFFFVVIDIQLQELNERFNEVNTELLLCLASLCPGDSFVAFDKKKLVRFAEYYPKDFSTFELMILDDQLETYIIDVRTTEKFLGLKSIGDLAQKMVETKKDIVYPLVYRLITLALILPVVTAMVERVFSSMNILKNRLRNRMGDQWMNDCLLVYIEKDIFNSLDNEVIMQRFQNMKTRRGRL